MSISLESLWTAPPVNGTSAFFTEENFKKQSWNYIKEEFALRKKSRIKSVNISQEDVSDSHTESDQTNNEANITPVSNKLGLEKADKYDLRHKAPYWPFPRPNVRFPRRSRLNKNEHISYLHLIEKQSKNVSLSKKDTIMLKRLQNRVNKEHDEFKEFAKEAAKKNLLVYNYIHPEADTYVKELLKNKYVQVHHYPRHYSPEGEMELELKGMCPSLLFSDMLLQMGEVARVLLPTMKQKTCIPLSFQRVNDQFPVKNKQLEQNENVLYKRVVSRDPNAEELAIKYNASIVISSSGMKAFCDARNSYWEIPVTVKRLENQDKSSKIVFIDKILPPKKVSAPTRNTLYHKYAIKQLFIHPKCAKPFQGTLETSESEDYHLRRSEAESVDDYFEFEDISDLETFGTETVNGKRVKLTSPINSCNTGDNAVKPTNKMNEVKTNYEITEVNAHEASLKETLESNFNHGNNSDDVSINSKKSDSSDVVFSEVDDSESVLLKYNTEGESDSAVDRFVTNDTIKPSDDIEINHLDENVDKQSDKNISTTLSTAVVDSTVPEDNFIETSQESQKFSSEKMEAQNSITKEISNCSMDSQTSSSINDKNSVAPTMKLNEGKTNDETNGNLFEVSLKDTLKSDSTEVNKCNNLSVNFKRNDNSDLANNGIVMSEIDDSKKGKKRDISDGETDSDNDGLVIDTNVGSPNNFELHSLDETGENETGKDFSTPLQTAYNSVPVKVVPETNLLKSQHISQENEKMDVQNNIAKETSNCQIDSQTLSYINDDNSATHTNKMNDAETDDETTDGNLCTFRLKDTLESDSSEVNNVNSPSVIFKRNGNSGLFTKENISSGIDDGESDSDWDRFVIDTSIDETDYSETGKDSCMPLCGAFKPLPVKVKPEANFLKTHHTPQKCKKMEVEDNIAKKTNSQMDSQTLSHSIVTRSKTRGTNEKHSKTCICCKTFKEPRKAKRDLLHAALGASSSEENTGKDNSPPAVKTPHLEKKLLQENKNQLSPDIEHPVKSENPLDKILAMQEETLKGRQMTSNQITPPLHSKTKSQNFVAKENSKSFLQPPQEKNVVYSLWSLGEHRILIRCSVDAKIPPSSNNNWMTQMCSVFPKIEYQCAFGGEILTESESIRQWISSKIRMNCKIIRARINVANSEIMAIEEIDTTNSNPEIEMKATQSLYGILKSLNSLEPGQYILSKMTSVLNASLYKQDNSTTRGNLDLHSSYNYRLEEEQTQLKEAPWLPIDTTVLFRQHKVLNWIPGTFGSNKGIQMKKKKKKGRKKK